MYIPLAAALPRFLTLWKPNALKVQGLADEILGQAHQAVEVYEEAINLISKTGVKRRLDALKKRLG
jgi:hypothetical protein